MPIRTTPIILRDGDSERFWRGVDRRGPDECWNWTKAKRRGYGAFETIGPGKKTVYLAPRIAWFLTHGQPTGIMCHRCDNPSCCNPAHLFDGTPLDNMRDMAAKGRHWMHGMTHCKRGHPLSGDNVKFNRLGHRICKICSRAIKERYNRKIGKLPLLPRSHCKRGHPFTDENTIRQKKGRTCRACWNVAAKRWREQRKAKDNNPMLVKWMKGELR